METKELNFIIVATFDYGYSTDITECKRIFNELKEKGQVIELGKPVKTPITKSDTGCTQITYTGCLTLEGLKELAFNQCFLNEVNSTMGSLSYYGFLPAVSFSGLNTDYNIVINEKSLDRMAQKAEDDYISELIVAMAGSTLVSIYATPIYKNELEFEVDTEILEKMEAFDHYNMEKEFDKLFNLD